MLGIPVDGGLQFVGRVGTGFTEKELTKLKGMLKPLETDESPFNARLSNLDAKGVTFFGRSSSARCATANGHPTTDCVNRVGGAFVRTRCPTKWSGSSSHPRRRLNSRRDDTPSLAKMLLRCHSTVRGLMNRWLAISELVKPSPASRAM